MNENELRRVKVLQHIDELQRIALAVTRRVGDNHAWCRRATRSDGRDRFDMTQANPLKLGIDDGPQLHH
jgi:hypothetical protein